MSRPAWARGLKRAESGKKGGETTVAPRMGAWIETYGTIICRSLDNRRAPHGRVD